MHRLKLPLTVSALWSLKRLETSPRTSQWPTGTHRHKVTSLFPKHSFKCQVSCKQCELVCHLCIQLIHDEVAQ